MGHTASNLSNISDSSTSAIDIILSPVPNGLLDGKVTNKITKITITITVVIIFIAIIIGLFILYGKKVEKSKPQTTMPPDLDSMTEYYEKNLDRIVELEMKKDRTNHSCVGGGELTTKYNEDEMKKMRKEMTKTRKHFKKMRKELKRLNALQHKIEDASKDIIKGAIK